MRRALSVLLLTAALPVLHVAAAAAAAPSCDRPTIVGTGGADRLVGTDGPDVIAGRGGRDVIEGGGGNDLLCGGAGADVLRGGPGDDRLLGGRDRILHDAQIGRMSVGDRLDGGPGDDLLDAGHDPRTAGVELGDAQLDRLEFQQAPGAVTVRLDRGTAEGDGRDRIVVRGRLDVRTGADDDLVVGTDAQEMVHTGDGADVVRARGGDDWVVVDRGEAADDDVVAGGPGDDSLFAGNGADRLSGGAGRDQVSDEGSVGADRLLGGRGDRDVVTNEISDATAERADGGAGTGDYLWNTDPAEAYPDGSMTCVGFELMRDAGPWC